MGWLLVSGRNIRSQYQVAKSGRKQDPGLQADAQVLLEPDAEAVLPLGLAQAGERAHLGLVLGAAPDLRRSVGGELAVARVAVAQRGEPGADPRRQGQLLGGRGAVGNHRLAVEAAGGAGARGDRGERPAPPGRGVREPGGTWQKRTHPSWRRRAVTGCRNRLFSARTSAVARTSPISVQRD